MNARTKNCLIYAAVCVALLPILLLRDFTPSNELRYLSIADEALDNGTFFAFTNHGAPYADKPPLYLWWVMLCRWMTGGHHMWLIALFSLLPALGTVAVLNRWTRDVMSGTNRRAAMLMTLTAGLFIGSAITLRMDMLMCFFIVLALYEFWNLQKLPVERMKRFHWRLPLFLFLALFTKGPYGIMIPLAATLVYMLINRRMRDWLRIWNWSTWLVLVALCALWFTAVFAEGGKEYLNNLLFHQTLDRAVNSFHHDKPFYYYAISIWYSIAPWSLVSVAVIIAALTRRARRTQLETYFLSIVIVTFVMLSCISAKLQIYLLPAFPFMTWLTAMFLPQFGKKTWFRILTTVTASILLLILPGVLIATHLSDDLSFISNGWVYAAATVFTLTGLWAILMQYVPAMHREAGVIYSRMGMGILLAVFLAGWALPQVNSRLGYRMLCEQTEQMAAQHGITEIAVWSVPRSDNMDVYLGRQVTIIEKDSIPHALNGKPTLLMVPVKRLGDIPACHDTRRVGPYSVTIIE